MKQRRKAVAAIMLFSILLTGCGNNKKPEKPENNMNEEGGIGGMLTLTAIDENQKAITDDSGMNGTGGRIHLHSAEKDAMYESSEKTFIFDAGHIEKLGKMYLWNYNAAGNTNSGLKEIRVSSSEDNSTYTEPVNYTLSQAAGTDNCAADQTVLDFKGMSGRYIKIEAVSNYGGDSYGLSEARLFRYKQPVVEGEVISCSPLERFINNKWSAEPNDYNFLSGSGLSAANSLKATHDNNPEHMFAQSKKAIDFIIDLKGQYPVSKLVLWNYNDPQHLDYGLKKFKLKVSDDYSVWKTIGTYTMDQADGSEALAPSLTIDLEEVRGHYLQIEILENYGGNQVGLSEVSAVLGSGWYCESAPDYTALFSNYDGWTGADGIYTVNLNGKDYADDESKQDQKTFFIFSDTIVSKVDPVTKLREGVSMPNNTSALLTGGEPDRSKITFQFPVTGEDTANILPSKPIPATKAGKFIYYWLGDTFVSGNYLYVFCLRIDSVNSVYGFEQIGVDLARYDIKDGEVDYDSLTIINDEEKRLCDISNSAAKWYFGGAVYQSTEAAGVIDPDGYVYIYGYQDINNLGRQLIVLRAKPESIEDFSSYEYLSLNGEWAKEQPSEFKFLASDVAPECSVSQIQEGERKGQFLFINTHITNTPTIKASISKKPYEEFTDKTTIYSHDDCLTIPGEGNNTYNAKAHPALSKKSELLISYNINGNDCFQYADIYRPRFVKLGTVGKR